MKFKSSIFIVLMLFVCGASFAQDATKSDFQQQAEDAVNKGSIFTARYNYLRAFDDYVDKSQLRQGVECAVKASQLYHRENLYNEAFDLLRRVDQVITLHGHDDPSLHYLTSKERMQMYMKMKRGENVKLHLGIMEGHANASKDESLKNDLLYNKAVYYYTFGQNAQGNAVFKQMADKLTAEKEFGKIDEVYQTLISNARKSGNASMVAQSYSNYIAWKDSVTAIQTAEERDSLQQLIDKGEAEIADKDSSLSSRQVVIVALSVLAAALAAVLVIGAVVLLRYMHLTRKQKKLIKTANENNALKSKFIGNISAQMEPTLRKLDAGKSEVKALIDFTKHIQTLSQLENPSDDTSDPDASSATPADTQVQTFCQGLADQIRNEVKRGVTISVEAPKMTVAINREHVEHILLHLLRNAAYYTPENGKITLDFKKRSAHKCQFIVSDTGEGIAEEKRENVFKPFLEVKDITDGDGLGLPICRMMALKMNGDLYVDSQYSKGARFVLDMQI